MVFGKVIWASKVRASLTALISDQFVDRSPIPPLAPESFIRCSSFANLCPREEVLCTVNNIIRHKDFTADTLLTFALGTGMHHAMQNIILPERGVLYGQWRCLGCGHLHGAMNTSVDAKRPAIDHAIARPTVCSCGNTSFLYEEVSLKDDNYRITGHPDGFLKLSEYDGIGLLEVKSISQKGAWEVKNCPKMDHVVQAQLYLWFTGLKWAQILYWDKGTYGISSLIEHHIERDDSTIDEMLSSILEIWDGVRAFTETKEVRLSERICTEMDCPRAKMCSVAKQCFAEAA